MRQPIGLHATNQRSAELFTAVEQLQPTAVLILDGLGEAVHIHERLGVPYVFHRVFNGNEGSLWNNRLSAYKAPSKWIDEWRNQGHPEIARVVLNEPGISSEEEMARLFDYLMDVGDRAAAAGFKASLGGFATANTIREGWLWSEPTRTVWRSTTVYDRFLRWAADWTTEGHGFVDWHNYSTFPPVDGNGDATALLDPARCQRGQWKTRQQVLETNWRDNWLMYRDVWLAKRCEALGVSMHHVVYGEGWADAMPNLASIYSQLEAQLPGLKVEGPFSMGVFYANRFPGHTQPEVMRWVDEWIIDTMPAYAVGLCFFAWNFNAPWHNNRAAGGRMYNVGERPDVLSEMYRLKERVQMPDYGIPVSARIAADYNLREQPTTSGKLVVTVTKNSEVKYYPVSKTVGGAFNWLRVDFGAKSGWMADQGQFVPIDTTPAPSPTVLVHVPFRSQIGSEAPNANDCGPACVASVANWAGLQLNDPVLQAVTVGNVSAYLGHGNNTTSLTQLERALEHWAVPAVVQSGPFNGMTPAAIRAELDAGRPVIMLVHRAKLKPTFYNFDGSHFIAVVGYAPGWMFYHDPLGVDAAQGAIIPMKDVDFEAAIYETPGNAGLHYAGVTVALPVVVPPNPKPDTSKSLIVKITGPTEADVDVVMAAIRTIITVSVTIANNEAEIELVSETDAVQ